MYLLIIYFEKNLKLFMVAKGIIFWCIAQQIYYPLELRKTAFIARKQTLCRHCSLTSRQMTRGKKGMSDHLSMISGLFTQIEVFLKLHLSIMILTNINLWIKILIVIWQIRIYDHYQFMLGTKPSFHKILLLLQGFQNTWSKLKIH